jgi:hypothetical protein
MGPGSLLSVAWRYTRPQREVIRCGELNPSHTPEYYLREILFDDFDWAGIISN